MIPEDKFGNKIFPYIFQKLKENEKVLLSIGYIESKTKPNLFYRTNNQNQFFADMRGTKIIPIWKDTFPLFYYQFNQNLPNWQRRRLIKEELKKLHNSGCPCRCSFFFDDNDEFKDICINVDEEKGEFEWDDGYCNICGKNFQNEGSFCSKECEYKYKDNLKEKCEVCNKRIEFSEEVFHHITYSPWKTIPVHASCHNKIHKTNLFSHLKPSKEEIKEFYKPKIKKIPSATSDDLVINMSWTKYHLKNCKSLGRSFRKYEGIENKSIQEVIKRSLNKKGMIQPCNRCLSYWMKENQH